MTQAHKAIHPVKVAGKVIPAGGDIDPEKIGAKRLERLVTKGRVAAGADAAEVNRAETTTGKPNLKLPETKVEFGQ